MSNCIMGLFGRTADAVAPYGTVKRATCLATLLQTSSIAMLRFLPPTFEHVLQQVRSQGFFFVDGKTPNIAVQLVLR